MTITSYDPALDGNSRLQFTKTSEITVVEPWNQVL